MAKGSRRPGNTPGTGRRGDIRATRDLLHAGEVLKIALVDHVRIGRPSPDHASPWVSLRALGYFA